MIRKTSNPLGESPAAQTSSQSKGVVEVPHNGFAGETTKAVNNLVKPLLATGKRVKIAIIDDGIHPNHPDVKNLMGGVRFTVGPDDSITVDGIDWTSESIESHGTMCAALISRKVPDAHLYSLRVLDENRRGHPLALIAAIEWAILHEMSLVNLSLGTTNTEYASALHATCKAAAEARTILVAATHPKGLTSYPSHFRETIRVGQDDRYKDYEYGFAPTGLAEFLASGSGAVCVNGHSSSGTSIMHVYSSSGTSLATARVTANIGALLETMPNLDVSECKEKLADRETKLKHPQAIDISPPVDVQVRTLSTKRFGQQIRTVALYPFDSVSEIALSNRDQFSFQIKCVVDPVHVSMAGRDAGELCGNGILGIRVVKDLDSIPPEVDTLIVGDLDALHRASRMDRMSTVLEWAISNNRNVCSLGPDELLSHQNLLMIARQKKISIDSALESLHYVTNGGSSDCDADVPVLGVFGTSFNQAKFTTQLAIRRSLMAERYDVSMVGTNPLCSLIESAFYIPQDSRAPNCVPLPLQVSLWQGTINYASKCGSDLILLGTQGPAVPIKLYKVTPRIGKDQEGITDLPSDYSIPALVSLMAAHPDAVLLVVNPFDPVEYIKRTIATIESLGQTTVIAIVISDRVVLHNIYKFTQTLGRSLFKSEILELKKEYEACFGIPAFCLGTIKERRAIGRLIIDSFAEQLL